MKAARRKLEVPMPAAMPCKIQITSSGETHRNIGKRKTKFACIVDADENTRLRLEGAEHKPHQDHITAKGMNSVTHYSLVHKFIPMPQALKFQMQRQQWRKNGKNLRKSQHGSWRKSETRKRWSMKQRLWAEKFILRHWWICVISRIRSWKLSIKSTKAGGTPVWHCKRWSGSCAVFTEQGSSASQVTAAKVMDIISRLPGCAGQAADAVSAYTQVKMEDAPSLLKIPKSDCPVIWIRQP